jgi:hypothetical protein
MLVIEVAIRKRARGLSGEASQTDERTRHRRPRGFRSSADVSREVLAGDG